MSDQDDELTLPSGEVVPIRGLTGMEVALISKRNAQLNDDLDAPAGVAIQVGLVVCGKTRVRDAEAAGTEWLLTHTAADFTAVGNAIEERSGFGSGATKSNVDRAEDDG